MATSGETITTTTTTTEAAMKSCFRCGLQKSKLRRCSKCKGVWYCGPECQKKDWVAGHKNDCGKKTALEVEEEEEEMEDICDKVQVSYGALTAKDVISGSPKSGYVKFPAANLGQFILKSAAESGARLETKGTEVFVDVVSQCDRPDGQDWIFLQIENLQRMGRLIEMLDAAYDYEAVVRFHFDVLLQHEELSSSSSTTSSDLLQWDSHLSALASKCLRIYVYLSSLPHAVRDFASSLKFVEKGISFADKLQDDFPDTRRNVYPVLTQLRELRETTLRCMGLAKNPASDTRRFESGATSGRSSSSTSTSTKDKASADDDDDFRRLVGVGDTLTLEERIDRAVDSGDDVEALKTLRHATQYFISLGDAKSVVEYASRFRTHAQKCYDRLEGGEAGSSSSSSSFESRLKVLTKFYVKAIETFVDQALPRIQGQSGQDAADATQHAAFLAHAADLRDDDALEATTRCANWLEVGRVRRPQRVTHAVFDVDVLVDRASARDYRLRVREILLGRGRDFGGESGDGGKTIDCAICLDEMEIESCGGGEIRILPKCFHMFHEECLIRFEDEEARIITCPVCKQVNKAL